jgi:3-hydroxyacyl-[acyl-carrier-protein] dehydratase
MATMSETEFDQRLERLPHRPPMRLVERIVEILPGRSARTTRVAHASDWYFDGHFPEDPVVPGIAFVELLAQTGGLAVERPSTSGLDRLRLAAIHDFKFQAPAGPGALLEARAEIVGRMGALIKITGTVTANGILVASGSLTLAEVAASATS